MNLFSTEGLFARFLYLVADLVTLHFLWVLCSLPVFTIGASTTALCYALMKRIRTDEGYVRQNFLRAFRENFQQSTKIWAIVAVVGVVLLMDFRIALSLTGPIRLAMLLPCALLLLPYLLIALYIFPVQAKFDQSIAANFKNAFLMSFHSFGYSLILFLILGSFAAAALIFPPLVGLLLICGGGLVGYLCCSVFVAVFRRYLPDELEEDAEAAGL